MTQKAGDLDSQKFDEREIKENLGQLKKIDKDVRDRWQKSKFDQKLKRLEEIQAITGMADFWSDQNKAREILAEEKILKESVLPWQTLIKEIADILELYAMAEEEKDQDSLAEINRDIMRIFQEYDKLESLSLLNGEMDKNNAYLTIHPGAGGTESQDWAEMLVRMYLRWAESNKIHVQILDNQAGEQAGIKTFTALFSGENAYGLMKCEIGVHRLVRISPFDSQKRRHTSFASVYATPEVDDSIDIEIKEEDLRVDTYRSSGAGGQHVNTTDSAVRITHLPTNTVVQCQNERSQMKNKATAMKMLKSALYQIELQKQEDQINEKNSEKREIAWGSQIRSYVFHPYNMVKDHRTNFETGNTQAMMDGEMLDDFIYAFLKFQSMAD